MDVVLGKPSPQNLTVGRRERKGVKVTLSFQFGQVTGRGRRARAASLL